MSYTKGSWKVGYKDGSGKFGKYQGTYQSCVTVDNCLLATVWHHDNTDYPKDEPTRIAIDNANLISAAPELYEALKKFTHLDDIYEDEGWDEDCKRARQAILKAEGKS